jgi:plastocyanin
MNKNIILAFALVLIIIGGYYFLNQNQSNLPVVDTNQSVSNTPEPLDIEIIGQNFSFQPNQITVKKGQPVRIKFVNTQGFHDFVIDEFNIASKQLKENESEIIEFTPDKTGTFEFYCSVGEHRQMGMVGTLVVN